MKREAREQNVSAGAAYGPLDKSPQLVRRRMLQVLSTKTAPHKSEVKRQKQNSHQWVGDKEDDDVTAKTTVYKSTLNKVHNKWEISDFQALKLQALIKIIT